MTIMKVLLQFLLSLSPVCLHSDSDLSVPLCGGRSCLSCGRKFKLKKGSFKANLKRRFPSYGTSI